jgi:eukaryotic-like serine/threonine-protein kinase
MVQNQIADYIIGRRYRIQNYLGIGGMGEVYSVIDHLTNTTVALKRVHTHHPVTGQDELRIALAQEFRILAGLRHPNIVSVLDYGFDENRRPYFTMELVEDARDLLSVAGDLSVKEQVNLLTQILQALSYLHRRGIVHRDLKPENVLVMAQHQVKVLDFGLSVYQTHKSHKKFEVAGTIKYIAPEVLQGGALTPQADLYSFGVLAYELLTGHHPFEEKNLTLLLSRVISEAPGFAPFEGCDELLPLRSVVEKLLTKSAVERFASADETMRALCNAAGIPLPVENPLLVEGQLQTAQFVGRKEELSVLTAHLDSAMAGQGSVCLIGGESGAGKSRLAEELRIRALVKGALVLRGQVVERGSLPYHLWRTPIRTLLLQSPDLNVDPVLKDIVPDLAKITGRKIRTAPLVEGTARLQRLAQAIVEVLRQQKQPIVLLLEDLQWVVESLDILKSVAQAVYDLPVMILGTYRSEERPNLPEEMPSAHSIILPRLEPNETAQLSASMLGRESIQPHMVDFLQQETEGNPFFVLEIMRILITDAGSLDGVGSHTLPSSIFAGGMRQAVQRRLARVPQDAMGLLKIAAVAGRQLNLSLLAHFVSGKKLDTWLTLCANAAVLDFQDDQWRFAHDKLREAVLAEIEDRASYHRQIAQAYEAIRQTPNEYLEALSYHWGEANDWKREAKYCLLAGEQALNIGAYSKAQLHFERRLTLEREQDVIPRSPVRLLLGETYYALGHYEIARKLLTENLEQKEGLSRTYNLLGNIALASGEYELARTQLEQSLSISSKANEPVAVGKALRSLGVVAETMGEYKKAKHLYYKSLTYLTEQADPMGRAGAFANLGAIARRETRYAEALNLYEAALAQFEASGFQWGAAYTLTSMGLTIAQLNDFERAVIYHQRAIAICRKINHRWGTAFSLYNLAEAQLNQGDTLSVHSTLAEALKIALDIRTMPLVLDIFARYASALVEQSQETLWAKAVWQFVVDHPAAEPETVKTLKGKLAEQNTVQLNPETLTIDTIAARILETMP